MSWQTVKLGDICTIESGGTPARSKEEYWNGHIAWVKISDMLQENILFTDETITDFGLKNSSAKVLQAGTLLLSIFATVGRIALLEIDAATNQAIVGLTIRNKSIIDRGYLRHYLIAKTEQLKERSRGVAQSNINISILKTLDILLPPLPEQKRIAAILDKADELKRKREAAIAKLDQLAQSIFVEMFGNVMVNDKGWQTFRLGDVGTLDRGISKHRPRNAPELLGGNYPLVQTGEVANCDGYIRNHNSSYSEIGLRQSKMWPAGTLCITIAANIAKTGILTFDACFPDSVVGFRADNAATIEYVRVWLSFLQKMLEESAPESAQKNINLAILRELSIPFPPIKLQEEFRNRLKAMQTLKVKFSTALSTQNNLFSSLQHQAFAGHL